MQFVSLNRPVKICFWCYFIDPYLFYFLFPQAVITVVPMRVPQAVFNCGHIHVCIFYVPQAAPAVVLVQIVPSVPQAASTVVPVV